MTLYLGRKGWIGIAMEATSGTYVNPTDYLPFISNTILAKYTPIADISARGMRDKEFTSVMGKQQSGGDLEMNLDPTLSGYLFKLATGSENMSTLTSGVYQHTFSLNQTSTPLSASLTVYRGNYTEGYTFSVIKDLELSVTDALATVKASFIGQSPNTTASGTMTTTSGTLFAFKNLNVQFGATLAAAQAAVATPVTKLDLKISNNSEAIFESGSPSPAQFVAEDFQVSGEIDTLMNDTGELTDYYGLIKRYIILTFTGASLGGGYNEKITITVYRARTDDLGIDTGIDKFFAYQTKFVGEYSTSDSKTCDIVSINSKSTVY